VNCWCGARFLRASYVQYIAEGDTQVSVEASARNALCAAGFLCAVNAAIDRGITLFDTAEVYGPYHSEELLGKEWEENVAAADWKLTAEDKAEIDRICEEEGVPTYVNAAQAV